MVEVQEAPPQKKPEKPKLTRKQKLLRRTVPIVAGVTALGVSTGAFEKGVDTLTNLPGAIKEAAPDLYKEPVSDARFPVRIASSTTSRKTIQPVLRIRPGTGPTSHKISEDTLRAEGYSFDNLEAELVWGRPYDEPQSEDDQKHVKEIRQEFGLQEELANYWNIQKQGHHYGIWGKITLTTPRGEPKDIYTSLNFLRPPLLPAEKSLL